MDSDSYLDMMRNMVEEGHSVSMILRGNSMSPFITDRRDSIYIEPLKKDPVKGDMCFYRRSGGRYIMHRVYKTEQGKYWFVGDAQTAIEGPLEREQIWGIITKVQRKGKWITKGNFWWFFFEKIWINIVPLRPAMHKVYAVLTKPLRVLGIKK